jgi:asparagine synthase (glutamine-hydrolysing)
MCGICGLVSLNGGAVDRGLLEEMNATLLHRGPDSGGVHVEGGTGLAARRLAIIDLQTGDQPLTNEDGSVVVVQNGEIYNYRELRADLVRKGHSFRTQGDTEVHAHLYEEHGTRFAEHLRGMFAVAVWDAKRRRLVLARDRFGIKPLYYRVAGESLSFASELKALLRQPDFSREIDPDAVEAFLTFSFVPAPLSIFREAKKLPPGSVLVWEADGGSDVRIERYARPRPVEEAALRRGSEEELAEELLERLRDSVRAHLIADVPVGVLLSGGIDSCALAALASETVPHVSTFTIGFEERAFDERSLARLVAERYGTDHHELVLSPDAVELLPALAEAFDEPFADSSAIPTYLVSKLTREHVTVALTGDGGDEVFAGYLRFGAAVTAERLPAWAGRAAGAALSMLPHPANERHPVARGRRFVRFMKLPLQDRLAAWAGVFYDDLEELLDPTFVRRIDPIDRGRHLRDLKGVDGASPLSRLLAANFHSYLHDDLLVKADRMSMANSLEARAPFLDRALVEYVAGLPDHYKINRGVTKAILRQAFDGMIPDAVKRGGKKGFGVPLDAWFRSELGGYLRDTLLVPSARMTAYVSQSYVSKLFEDHVAGRANNGHRLWTLLTFERWLALLPSWQVPA